MLVTDDPALAKRAFEAWKSDHPDAPEKHWEELPYWVQLAYIHYLEAE